MYHNDFLSFKSRLSVMSDVTVPFNPISELSSLSSEVELPDNFYEVSQQAYLQFHKLRRLIIVSNHEIGTDTKVITDRQL